MPLMEDGRVPVKAFWPWSRHGGLAQQHVAIDGQSTKTCERPACHHSFRGITLTRRRVTNEVKPKIEAGMVPVSEF